MKIRALCWPLVIAVAGIVILLLAVNRRTLPLLAHWLDVGGPPQKADAVVLLNGSYDTRPLVAAALVHGGWAPKVVLSTVADHPLQVSGAVPSSWQIVLKMLAYGGVSRDRLVLLNHKATTTFDEATAVAEYLKDHPARRLMIVTEGPHTRRSRWIFRRVLGDNPVEITMISVPPDGFDNDDWWRSEAGFLFVMSEYFKLFYYGVRYGWLGYEIVAVLAVAIGLCAWFLWRRQRIGRSVSPAPK